MEQLSTLNTTEPIDFDNLNIIIRSRPPRRRQSGTSLVPFRPYVKCLTSIRKSFSFANGKDPWITMGKTEQLFKQENARCIGSLIDDCDVSDVIRWDIEGESTRLPMMCKLWIIVDGAVVERGKPHLVQDAAIQVYTSGRNRHSILSTEQRYIHTSTSKVDRRRRHSWHEINEYHSVPYYQYTRSVRSGTQESTQCDLDNEQFQSKHEILPFIYEEPLHEHITTPMEKHRAEETIHNHHILQERVHVSVMIQTECKTMDQSTETDYEFVKLFNFALETNENLLSSIANPYAHENSFNYDWQSRMLNSNSSQYANKSVSTGDDYPEWWCQLSTNILLSSFVTKHIEDKKTHSPYVSSRQHDQSVQTVAEENEEILSARQRVPLSGPCSNIRKPSSSVSISDHYQIIDETDDGNNARRFLPFIDNHPRVDSYGNLDSYLSDYQIDSSSTCVDSRVRRPTISSKQSDTGYNTITLNCDQESYSPLDRSTIQSQFHCSTNDINRSIHTENSENPSTPVLANLLERYERTLRERQRAIAVIDNELLDIDEVLRYYREKLCNRVTTQLNRPEQLYEDIDLLTSQSKEESPSTSKYISHLTKHADQSLASKTSETIVQDHSLVPEIIVRNSMLNNCRQRQPRFDYCDLCLNDHSTSSAWIRYNEQRIDQLQRRIDLMLQNDDIEEVKFLLANPNPIISTVRQRNNNILLKNLRFQNRLTYYHDRIFSPHRYNFRLPYRLNQSLANRSRLLTRTVTRSAIPILKSVRIAMNHDIIQNQTNLREQKPTSFRLTYRPTVSILRRDNAKVDPRRFVTTSHVWKSSIGGTVYILEQFSIPRYYRLYDDVNFREVYKFAFMLQSYVTQNQIAPKEYSSIVKNFALKQQLPTIVGFA